MDGPAQEDVRNWLLRALPPKAFASIRPHLRPVETPKGMTIFEPDEPLRFGYFFESGLGSVIVEAIPAAEFETLLETSPQVQSMMLRYVQFFLLQTGQTCLYNAVRPIEERLARWLLMSHDRLPGDDVPLTHDYLAVMLGASRTTVTFALGGLAQRGAIRTARGALTILDRPLLEQVAGDGYGLPEREYDRLIARRFGNATSRVPVSSTG